MKKIILLLGSTGKMGLALGKKCPEQFELIGLSSKDFQAKSTKSIRPFLERLRPWAIINTVGYLGIDLCENHPAEAFAINTLFPYELATLANEFDSTLVHFSSDAVFSGDEDKPFYSEFDQPSPINVYGVTKLGGDCLVQSTAARYFIPRISVLFGESHRKNQFVEKMINKIREGDSQLKISNDIICSPCFSNDIAKGVFQLLSHNHDYGVYHLANQGATSLYGLMREIAQQIAPKVAIEPASYLDFPIIGRKNLRTPLISKKIKPLRPWEEAIKCYLDEIHESS